MDFLKKNYEKVILGAVLVGLAVAVAFLPFKLASEKQSLQEVTSSVINVSPKPLTNVDLTLADTILKRVSSPITLNLTEPTRVFNPTPWQKTPDGRLVRLDSGTSGPRAVAIAKVTPLYLRIKLDSVTVVDSPRYVIGVEREAAANPNQRAKSQKYCKLNDKNEIFSLREVKGPPDNPTNIVLELNDSGAMVSISKEAAYERVDGYMVDLKYENKTWPNKRVNTTIPLGGEEYKIVAINKDEVILLAPNGKKTTIKYNATS